MLCATTNHASKLAWQICLFIQLPLQHITPSPASSWSRKILRTRSEFVGSHPNARLLILYRNNLKKALTIAELRSPNRDDGPIARILFTQAKVLESDTFGKYQEEAETLRRRAATAQQELLSIGEGGEIPVLNEEYADRDLEEDSYDALVPLFYR
jgi:hypothetical protein